MYNVKTKKTGVSKMLLEINVSKDAVMTEFKRLYESLKREAEIPGFRKGKAPLEMIKKQFGKKIHEEALKNLVSEYYINALREKQLIPIEHPQFEVKKFCDDGELIFSAEFTVKPEVKINNYKGLKVSKKPSLVKTEEIDKTIEYLRQSRAEFSPVLELRPVKEGDFLSVDYQCYSGPELLDKKENALLSTKDTAFPKEFIDQLIGVKIGEEKEINITLPAKFANSQLAGKPVTFKIKVKEIKKKTLPAVNDEFAKDLGLDSLDKLKANVGDDLKRQKEAHARSDMQNQIIEQLVDKVTVQIPESMLKQQTDALVEDAKNRLEASGDEGAVGQIDDKTLNERMKPQAEKQLKIFFALDRIAQEENIAISDEEVDNRVNILAAQSGQSVLELKKKIEEAGSIAHIKGQIKDEKTLDFLLKQADIKETKGG